MRRLYGILLILVGLVFLLALREQLVQGMSVFTGNVSHLADLTRPEPSQPMIVLSYAIPLAAIGIGITTGSRSSGYGDRLFCRCHLS